MPGRDGTGPAGRGPVTGRGAGFCNGFDRKSDFNRGGGFGRGFGRGGGGFGYGAGRGASMNFPYMGVQRVTDEQYNTMLSDEVKCLEARIEEIKNLQSKNEES